MPDGFLFDSLALYLGRTVTIFTTSGGLSGSGFTGVLAAITETTVKLITDIGAAPACPVGSSCNLGGFGTPCGYSAPYGGGYGYGGYGCGGGCGCGCGGGYGYGGGFVGTNWLGSVTEIPVDVTKYTLFVRVYSGAFQEFTRDWDLQRSGDKGLSLIGWVKGYSVSELLQSFYL